MSAGMDSKPTDIANNAELVAVAQLTSRLLWAEILKPCLKQQLRMELALAKCTNVAVVGSSRFLSAS